MLTCHQYDYVEIVCMYHYPLQITLKSGLIVEGVAIDTLKDEQKQECIKLENNGQELIIALDNMTSLTVMVKNPHLKELSFV
ncbi:Rho-binding antiterminator [Psychromonas sp. 14N.309.X.WAT.B.A12]|uniref:Rho-binding antiterminator n=1 Tax=unclassified Psychromonas TaxID=2614957 RepID=UPI0025AFB9FE|nr:Rho-binding antiterminator [Psychromonas sp. 14N.309.X.WAT.B.A12]MDN2663065.1 Rho-binding antiterminator [Psychromonas sp. 14N.309.X.WAT.B.A12]